MYADLMVDLAFIYSLKSANYMIWNRKKQLHSLLESLNENRNRLCMKSHSFKVR